MRMQRGQAQFRPDRGYGGGGGTCSAAGLIQAGRQEGVGGVMGTVVGPIWAGEEGPIWGLPQFRPAKWAMGEP